MNVIEPEKIEAESHGRENTFSTLDRELEWEMEADTGAWVTPKSSAGVFRITLISSLLDKSFLTVPRLQEELMDKDKYFEGLSKLQMTQGEVSYCGKDGWHASRFGV